MELAGPWIPVRSAAVRRAKSAAPSSSAPSTGQKITGANTKRRGRRRNWATPILSSPCRPITTSSRRPAPVNPVRLAAIRSKSPASAVQNALKVSPRSVASAAGLLKAN